MQRDRRGGQRGRGDDGHPRRKPGPRTPPPEATGQEARYLWNLRADETPVKVTLSNGDVVIGTVTYFDHDMVKIQAIAGPSLFVRKTDIRYVAEVGD